MPTLEEIFNANQAFLAEGEHSYSTELGNKEPFFRAWVRQNSIPFDPNAAISDYDMRGFWLALQNKDPKALTAINPNDKQLHFPDYWKTPYHESFSNESQWADPAKAPRWNEQDQLVTPKGQVVFDERKRSLEQLVKQNGKIDPNWQKAMSDGNR